MDTGVAIFPTYYSVDPAALARLAEERGHAAGKPSGRASDRTAR